MARSIKGFDRFEWLSNILSIPDDIPDEAY